MRIADGVADIGAHLAPVFGHCHRRKGDFNRGLGGIHDNQEERRHKEKEEQESKDYLDPFGGDFPGVRSFGTVLYTDGLHYISTSLFLLIETWIRETMTSMMKNIMAFAWPWPHRFFVMAVL